MNPVEMPHTVLLAGGVGGAKLADGLSQLMSADKLTIIVNTGDDFQHLGLTICPDLDTVMYTLSGVANMETGWGRSGESWRTLDEVQRLGGPSWFRLGDLDLATHLLRTHLLTGGATLTHATRHLCNRLGVGATVLPMCDEPAPTMIQTSAGMLPFQTWFVEQEWQPAVCGVILPADVRATPAVMAALQNAEVVILAPSNPFVSIDPILNVYPIREMVTDLPDVVLAVTPIIGGRAVKGPAAKMMAELAMETTAASVAEYYNELIDVFVYDRQDESVTANDDMQFLQLDTVMNSRSDRLRLATDIMAYLMELRNQ